MGCASLAAKSSNDPRKNEFSLVAILTNNELVPLVVSQAAISFPGLPVLGSTPFSGSSLGSFSPGETKAWFVGSVILPVSVPATVSVTLSCAGFDSINLNMPLAQYVSPAPGGGYAFPAQSGDLKQGEFWTGMSGVHGLAYDLFVQVFSASTNLWETLPPGADKTRNDNFYIWGKPVYAMADGVVVSFQDNIPANTPPLKPTTAPARNEGNHFYIQHGLDLALYAHFQAGTLNPALMSVGAAVVKGQQLALVGNSGWSSMPHLHIHVVRSTVPASVPPRPLPFSGIHVLDLALANSSNWPPTFAQPWNAVSAQCLPSVASAIWPGQPVVAGTGCSWLLVQSFAWIWIIVIGGLMLAPGGINCVVCGPQLNLALGIASVVLGVVGLVAQTLANRTARKQRA
jgi:hypothetical protein